MSRASLLKKTHGSVACPKCAYTGEEGGKIPPFREETRVGFVEFGEPGKEGFERVKTAAVKVLTCAHCGQVVQSL